MSTTERRGACRAGARLTRLDPEQPGTHFRKSMKGPGRTRSALRPRGGFLVKRAVDDRQFRGAGVDHRPLDDDGVDFSFSRRVGASPVAKAGVASVSEPRIGLLTQYLREAGFIELTEGKGETRRLVAAHAIEEGPPARLHNSRSRPKQDVETNPRQDTHLNEQRPTLDGCGARAFGLSCQQTASSLERRTCRSISFPINAETRLEYELEEKHCEP